MSSFRTSQQNNIADSLKMFGQSLYQMASFITTAFIVVGKALFDFLHFRFVKPQKRSIDNERIA